jgi:hypothetical protein
MKSPKASIIHIAPPADVFYHMPEFNTSKRAIDINI